MDAVTHVAGGGGEGLHLTVLVRGAERYVWLWEEAHRIDVLRSIGRFAGNPELSLTWYDAAVVSERITEQRK